jgi:phage terminase large subunit GpA-like protein
MTESRTALVRIIAPPSRLRVSEFAEEFFRLPQEGNAEPGKYHLDRMPWQIDMLDDPLDDSVDEHVWMLASQLGKTLCIIIIIAYGAKIRPKKILVVYPKLDDARDWLMDKLIPAFEETPCMAGIIKNPRQHNSKSRGLNRKYPGGGLVAVGSISTSSLRRLSAEWVIQDEIDDFETTKQGDSMELADLRAATFANAFRLKSSTPTNAGESRVNEKYEASDKELFFVPCPCCGHMQPLELRSLKFSFSKEELARFEQPNFNPNLFTWDLGSDEIRAPEKTIIVCERCGGGWSDADRIRAIKSRHPDNPPVVVCPAAHPDTGADNMYGPIERRAEWRATAPKTKIKGRRLPGYYRLIGKPRVYKTYLHWFAELFLKAKRGGVEKLRVWTNTFDANVFELPSEKLDWNPIHQRAEDYAVDSLPVEVCLVVAGVDIQQDRVEILTYGFGDGEEAWALTYDVVWGRFDLVENQQRVDEVLLSRFKHPILGELPIAAVGMDTGHQTRVKEAYQFCRAHKGRNIWAFKGSPHPLGTVYSASEMKAYGIKLFSVNTDFLKTTVYDRLKNPDPGPRYIHFPKSIAGGRHANFDEKFYRMLCSEKRRSKKLNGETIYFWDKITARNEILDMTVYAFGTFDILKPQAYIARQWAKVQAELKKRLPPPAPEAAAPVQPPTEYVVKPAAAATPRKRFSMHMNKF